MTPNWCYDAADEVLARLPDIRRHAAEARAGTGDPATERAIEREEVARTIAATFFGRDAPTPRGEQPRWCGRCACYHFPGNCA
jgi:hypothetical protein